jgi:hypothetical protein
MHSDWFNEKEILQGRRQHGETVGLCYPSGLEKTLCKWDIYVPLVTKGLKKKRNYCISKRSGLFRIRFFGALKLEVYIKYPFNHGCLTFYICASTGTSALIYDRDSSSDIIHQYLQNNFDI